MNYYFLLEDDKSLFSILPTWLEFMNFGCTRVREIQDIENNNYILESGQGVTQLETDAIFKTIDTLQDYPNIIDKLVIIADAEDVGFVQRKERVLNSINNKYSSLPCEIKIFVCNRCFETWLLGCKGLSPYHKDNISPTLKEYYDFYDIENNNPELMEKPTTFNNTVASYHFQYIHELLLDISRKKHQRSLSYTKNKTGCTTKIEYFDAIVNRINDTEDLFSFKEFYDFIISERENNIVIT